MIYLPIVDCMEVVLDCHPVQYLFRCQTIHWPMKEHHLYRENLPNVTRNYHDWKLIKLSIPRICIVIYSKYYILTFPNYPLYCGVSLYYLLIFFCLQQLLSLDHNFFSVSNFEILLLLMSTLNYF